MNRLEHILDILGEEGSELHQSASKAMRFGVHEQRDLPRTNLERMQEEYNDVLALVTMFNDMMAEAGHGRPLQRDHALIGAKILKVEKYLLYSAECGTLQE